MIKSPNTNDLPAEIVISVETFLKQVTAPTHPAPFTPDQISNLFQSFYSRTFNILPTFLPSPSPSTINLQPLLTGTEISDRKRIRGESLVKKQIWEEEIEKRVTTGVYERIFAPKTSDDGERDLKLQGKLKALVIVGVTLEHLGVELTDREKKLLIPSVEAIGKELHALDQVKTPREKLEILLRVHKILVDGLMFPSENGSAAQSSSADLLLPCLIYSIIQANVDTLISNIQFIQRFRADSLLQGEASYCLTNLEAAITFLETVDLHSLNLDPPQDIPLQRTTSTPPLKHRAPSLPLDSADPLNALPPDTNDSALKSLAGALEASYKLLWNQVRLVDPPRTLDDVRKLVSRPFTAEETETKESRDSPLSKLIVGTGVDNKPSRMEETGRGNLITSGFWTLGTSLSRPFSSTRTPTPTTPQNNKIAHREMQNMVGNEGLSGTQSRKMIPVEIPESSRNTKKIKRVDSRLLETEAGEIKVADVEVLVRELRRVVVALDELGGFEDALR